MTMNGRSRLPNRRPSSVLSFMFNGMEYTATMGFYPDGALGEVFIDCSRIGSTAAHMAQDAAVLISLAIQHGVPIEVMRAAMGRGDDPATGPMQPHSVAGAVLDLIDVEGLVTWPG